jgi:hypothetical protein
VHASAKPAIPPAIKWVEGATLGLLFGLSLLLIFTKVIKRELLEGEEKKKRYPRKCWSKEKMYSRTTFEYFPPFSFLSVDVERRKGCGDGGGVWNES